MCVWILHNAWESQTLRALKDLGMSISTIRTKRGNQINVARMPLACVIDLNERRTTLRAINPALESDK
jgi:hypothetical protein